MIYYAKDNRFGMIVFDLICANDHVFEAWFASGATFNKQAKAGKVMCPDCGSVKVHKAPMAPAIAGAHAEQRAENAREATHMRSLLVKLRREVERNGDYVGAEFAERARRIHYGETEKRSIYGESTVDEARALKEEGIPFATIPWIPNTDG